MTRNCSNISRRHIKTCNHSTPPPSLLIYFSQHLVLSVLNLQPLYITMANCYSERQNNGFFTLLENQLLNLEPTSTFALGAMTYGTDFCSVYSPPEKENGFGRTLFHYLNDNGEKGDEVGLIFFGEMCHSSHGTQISAKGNHSLGRNPKVSL
jgi:hypothetical protein